MSIQRRFDVVCQSWVDIMVLLKEEYDATAKIPGHHFGLMNIFFLSKVNEDNT